MATVPFIEEAPRHRGSNFYFTQEDLLREYAEKYNWRSIITRPWTIIGLAKGISLDMSCTNISAALLGNFMNFAVTIALYATVRKELGEPLLFPGHKKSWRRISDHSTAFHNADFQLWAACNEAIQHETFNIANGDLVHFEDLWPKIEA